MSNFYERLNGGLNQQLESLLCQCEGDFMELTQSYLRKENPVFKENLEIREEITEKLLENNPRPMIDRYSLTHSETENECGIFHFLLGLKFGIALAK